MFTSLHNRITKILVVAIGPACLGLLLMSHRFATVDAQVDSFQDSGSANSVAASESAANDDGPGLGGGYASIDPGPIALDGPGGSTPYLIF